MAELDRRLAVAHFVLPRACAVGNCAAVRACWDLGADVRRWSDKGTGRTLVHIACFSGRLEAVRLLSYLRAAGVDLAARDASGASALHWAVVGGNPAMVYRLLDAGLSAREADSQGWTPLHLAAARGDLALAGSWRVAAAGFIVGDDRQARPAAPAMRRRGLWPGRLSRAGVAEALTRSGCRCAASDEPCDRAARCGWYGAGGRGGRLLARGAAIDLRDGAGRSALHIAAWKGHPGCAAVLLSGGLRGDMVDGRGRTALHVACAGGRASIVRGLLAGGGRAVAGARDHRGRSPLHYAVAAGSVACIGALLDAWRAERGLAGGQGEADGIVQAADRDGVSPLHLAAARGDAEVLALLLADLGEVPSAVSLADREGRTALHLAAARGSDACVAALLACGADPFARDAKGRTPLFLAARRGCQLCCERLLVQPDAEERRMVGLCDDRGRSPLHMAARRGDALLCGASSERAPIHRAGTRGDGRRCTRLLRWRRIRSCRCSWRGPSVGRGHRCEAEDAAASRQPREHECSGAGDRSPPGSGRVVRGGR